MLNNNKTYDNSNLRDHLKVFNDGIVHFYESEERVLIREKAHFYYSRESISYETYLKASQNTNRAVIAIGIPAEGNTILPGDIAEIEGEYYKVDHIQFKDYGKPNYYKVYLNGATVPYMKETENEEI